MGIREFPPLTMEDVERALRHLAELPVDWPIYRSSNIMPDGGVVITLTKDQYRWFPDLKELTSGH